jgi:acyl-CoA oxidase
MENLKLKVFIPFFNLIWSDDLLTQKEHLIIKDFIQGQNWLTINEKEFLASQIAISNPPSRIVLTAWKSEIDKAIAQNPRVQSIFDIVLELAKNDVEIIGLATEFIQLENDLGILGEEVVSNFKKNATTFTSTHHSAPTFEIAKLTQILDGKQSAIIQKVKAIISRPEFAYETSTDTAIYREKVYEWCKILAEENLGNMAYPKKYGGGENIADYFAIMETLSYHDLSLVIKFGVQFGLWGMSIHSLGTEKHYQKYLKDIGTLKLPGCFAMSETNHGSNVKGLETTATYNHKDKTFLIHTPHEKAQKEYIGNAAVHGQMATVFAKLIIDEVDYGVNAFVVPLRDENNTILKGITIKDCGLKMGLNGVDNGIIRFDNVIIPKDNMLDRFASVNDQGKFESPIPSDNRRFFTMLGTLVGGRIGIPRSALSAAKSGLAIAIKYSDKRKQFGPEGGEEVSILNYRMHQRRLFPLLAKTYAIHFALQYVTTRFIERTELEMPEIEALAAGIKAYTTWNTTATLQECREACGGKGYLSENRIGALKNDTEIYTTFEGDNTVLMQLVAKNRLSEFRKTYGKMDARGIINYVYENTKTVIAEKNPIVTRKTDEAHLLDSAFHLSAFEYREKTILISAAKRLKKLIIGGLEPYDAFNVVQHQMIDVAQAYLDRVVLEQFNKAIESFEDKKSKDIVTKLSQLYALSQIEKNKGWYLENGYLEAVKTKAVRKMVNQLCWELRPEAVSLVNAFAIPDSCLAAPIVI